MYKSLQSHPTTRLTSDVNDFVNAKSHAREKPLLAGYGKVWLWKKASTNSKYLAKLRGKNGRQGTFTSLYYTYNSMKSWVSIAGLKALNWPFSAVQHKFQNCQGGGFLSFTYYFSIQITANGRSDEIKLSVDCGKYLLQLKNENSKDVTPETPKPHFMDTSLLSACKESTVRQPGAIGFCYRANEFCS